MTINELIDKMRHLNIPLPHEGSGINGRILARDLENALGDYYLNKITIDDPVKRQFYDMRRSIVPMKAYRYDKLSDAYKKDIFEDQNNWVAQEKYNGWRIVICFIPGKGFNFFGGNLSGTNFLPVDYTSHIRINGLHPTDESFHDFSYKSFMFDSECVCNDSVEMLSGLYSTNTLEAVEAILGSLPERAVYLQKEATLHFYIFDMLYYPYNFGVEYSVRLAHIFNIFMLRSVEQFVEIDVTRWNKKQYLNTLWKIGKEGIILKNINAPYVSGSRDRNINVKVKRSMSNEIGDDIDSFISGYVLTEKWSEKTLIGGIKLSVYLEDGQGERTLHHIATVSSMPDRIREQLTKVHTYEEITHIGFNNEYLNSVLVVDGQELSSRNMRLTHACVDWDRGFRNDKSSQDCVLKLKELQNEKF